MNFFNKIISFIIFCIFCNIAVADDSETNEELLEKAKQITEALEKSDQQEAQQEATATEDEEVPLNDPFAGNEGIEEESASTVNPETGEKRDKMSLYNFKLVGLISGTDSSYISLAERGSGEIYSVSLGQNFGKVKLVDLRLHEAIFQRDDAEMAEEDKKYIIIDFNLQVRESDEY
tara:strand:- start:12 stop:539 length:528 start_codon:yes stop_codon:yes gene_type:complete